jgi:hypothetical protein
MLRTPQLASPPFSPTKVITQTSLYTPKATLHPLVHVNLPWTWMNSTNNSGNQSLKHKFIIRTPPPDFKIGDKAFVKAEFIRTTRPSKKLSEKFLGPYEIISQVGSLSFTLHLPDSMHGIHPIFHVVMLEPETPNTIPNQIQPPPPPVDIDGKQEYEIVQVLDSKVDQRRKCKLLYLVKWSRYKGTDEETSWLPATELKHATELVMDFHLSYPHKPGPTLSP